MRRVIYSGRTASERDGQSVEIVGPVWHWEVDLTKTGPMFRIKFDDGYETTTFLDELEYRTFHDLVQGLYWADAPHDVFEGERNKQIIIDVSNVNNVSIEFDEFGLITRIEGNG